MSQFSLLFAIAAGAAAAIPVSDFGEGTLSPEWRFARCEVALAPGKAPDGKAALQVTCDFSTAHSNGWVRRVMDAPLDVGGTHGLSFRVHGDGSGLRIIPYLLLLEPARDGKTREVPFQGPAFSADFEGWRQYSISLDEFGLGEEERKRVRVVNFSVARVAKPRSEILFADIRFTPGPEGTVLREPGPESVPDEAAFYALLDGSRPELAAVAKASAAGEVEDARSAFIRYLETRERPRFFIDWRTREAFLATLREHYPTTIEGHQKQADRVLARDFLFEGDRRQLAHKVEWLQGPVEWTHILSRFGYWRSLAVAWSATGDDKYARDFVDLLRDWVASNPVRRRVGNSTGPNGNTWRTLEAGIRCDEWLRALYWFWDSPLFTDADKVLLLRSLVEHARYLAAHEAAIGFQHGNWQVVECAGLAMVALMLPELREAAGWRETAFRLLDEHLERDVYPDGTHHELTPGYHNWVAERIATVWRLAERNGVAVPANSREKLSRMFAFNLAVMMPDGAGPPVGDAGRGSLRSALGLGALLFDRPDLRSQGNALPPDSALWLLGTEAVARYREMPSKPPEFTSVRLPDAGYLVQRTGWKPEDLYLLLNAVPYGGGHSHPDSLSLDVHAFGTSLLTDSGRENYNHPLHRGYFRKTRAHNVVMVDGLEQPNDIRPKVEAWQVADAYEHAGASIEYAGLSQRRDVIFLKPHGWLVLDRVAGEGTRRLDTLFHFTSGPAEVDGKTLVARTTREKGANLAVVPALREGLAGRIEEGWIGFSAGRSRKEPMAVYTREAALPALLAWVLVPQKPGEQAEVAVEPVPVTVAGKPVPAHQAAAFRVRIGDARFLAALAYEPGDYTCAGYPWREGILVQKERGD